MFHLPIAVSEDDLENGDSPVVTVVAHAPHRIRRVVFCTKKAGGPPMVPSPESTGAFTFLGGALHFDYPGFDATGTAHTWQVRGEYAFVETVKHTDDGGYVLGSVVIPSAINFTLNQIYGGGQAPPEGAVQQAGPDVTMGYRESLGVDFTAATYSYHCPTFYPGRFLHNGMLNGDFTYAQQGSP